MLASDVEEEARLVAYTNFHLHRDNGSSSGSDTDTTKFQRLTYNDVLHSFNNYNVSCKYSVELDIIIS